MKNKKIPLEKKNLLKQKMENFQYLRKNRASYYQAISVVFGTAAIILLIDLIVKDDLIAKVILIVFLFIIAAFAYKKSLRQTQKPIFVAENAIGTIEKMAFVKSKEGEGYYVFSMSDVLHKDNK